MVHAQIAFGDTSERERRNGAVDAHLLRQVLMGETHTSRGDAVHCIGLEWEEARAATRRDEHCIRLCHAALYSFCSEASNERIE